MNQSTTDSQNVPTIETLRSVYDHCCELHSYFMTWRRHLVTGYLVTLAALGVAFSWTFDCANNARSLSWLVCLIGTFLTIIFWLLDGRNRELYRSCQNVAVDIETQLGFKKDSDSKCYIGLQTALRQSAGHKISHSGIMDILFYGAAIILVIMTIYSFITIK